MTEKELDNLMENYESLIYESLIYESKARPASRAHV